MGVYIKGMKMPQNCKQCEFETDELLCYLTGDHTDDARKGGRIESCPLVKVREPHGRLIDADNFLQRLSERDRAFSFYHDGMFVDISDMDKLLSSLKTVIEAEGGD